jgi:pyruvate dehydrogenase E1 component
MKPADDSPEMKYLHERRQALGGYLPVRKVVAKRLVIPELSTFSALLEGTGDREISTTMAFVRMLTQLLKDKNIGKNVVPIVPDEARTFGMEGLFRQIGIYSSAGQLYTPVDSEQLMSYREDKKGQMLEEGINEAGSTCSWIAAGTAYANHGIHMMPFYIYYSMFGFQRVGDFFWAAGDLRTRGFLLGATAGRTTLAGEGLQHQDGHSLLHAATVQNCVAYDPTYAYELAVIIHDGMNRMFANDESVFFYIAVMNENYVQPALPKGVEEGILKGMYLLQAGGAGKVRVTLMGSGTILREVIAAADMLAKDFGIPSDIYSATSFSELRREAIEIERWNRLHPGEPARTPYVKQALSKATGPFIAATDYMRAWPDMIREWVPGRFTTLGTDGFGRSDGRTALRKHFEVDAKNIVYASLCALADEGALDKGTLKAALNKLGLDPNKLDPQKA